MLRYDVRGAIQSDNPKQTDEEIANPNANRHLRHSMNRAASGNTHWNLKIPKPANKPLNQSRFSRLAKAPHSKVNSNIESWPSIRAGQKGTNPRKSASGKGCQIADKCRKDGRNNRKQITRRARLV